MGYNNNIKKWLKIALWVVTAMCIVIVSIAAMQKNNTAFCKKIEVTILSNKEQLFLNEKDILNLINANSIIESKTKKEVDVKILEAKLRENIWIENVELFFDKKNVLHIEVEERIPTLRIFRQNGNSFYMDKNKVLLPLSNTFSAEVPIFTGFGNDDRISKTDSTILPSIFKMANYIAKDSFWMAQIQQVNIVNANTFEIIPTIGNHKIIFGDTSNMHTKFSKLLLFYKKVSTKVGFDKYAVLNVQFKNQIIASSSNYANAIDTSKASLIIQNLMQSSLDTTLRNADTSIQNSIKQDTTLHKTEINKTAFATPNNTTTTNRQNNTNNKIPKRTTTTPKALMPKRPVVAPKGRNSNRSQQLKKQ
jgi:cell division protein FtsQ